MNTTSILGRDVCVQDDAEAMARVAAEWLCRRAVESGERIAICLAGGRTPRRLYEMLSEPSLCERFPWSSVHFFWGDERFVPHNSASSNFRMAREAMLAWAPLPAGNVHPVPTEGARSPGDAAAAYEEDLKSFYGAPDLIEGRPLFDVTLLGLGADGHIASLFPASPALEERCAWVADVAEDGREARVTLTYPALRSSRYVAFLVSGSSKRDALAAVLRGEDLPATRLRPTRSIWFVDRDAAGEGWSAGG